MSRFNFPANQPATWNHFLSDRRSHSLSFSDDGGGGGGDERLNEREDPHLSDRVAVNSLAVTKLLMP